MLSWTVEVKFALGSFPLSPFSHSKHVETLQPFGQVNVTLPTLSCRICDFAGEFTFLPTDDDKVCLIQPCRCTDHLRYIHRHCWLLLDRQCYLCPSSKSQQSPMYQKKQKIDTDYTPTRTVQFSEPFSPPATSSDFPCAQIPPSSPTLYPDDYISFDEEMEDNTQTSSFPKTKEAFDQLRHCFVSEAKVWFRQHAPLTIDTIQRDLETWREQDRDDAISRAIFNQSIGTLIDKGLSWATILHHELCQ